MNHIRPSNPTELLEGSELVEGSGSVQLPTNAIPHPQVIDLVNRVANSRPEPTPRAPAPPQPSASKDAKQL